MQPGSVATGCLTWQTGRVLRPSFLDDVDSFLPIAHSRHDARNHSTVGGRQHSEHVADAGDKLQCAYVRGGHARNMATRRTKRRMQRGSQDLGAPLPK